MRWNAHIFQREISDRIDLTRQYVGCCMDALQSHETIRRIRLDRGGIWVIVKGVSDGHFDGIGSCG